MKLRRGRLVDGKLEFAPEDVKPVLVPESETMTVPSGDVYDQDGWLDRGNVIVPKWKRRQPGHGA